MNVARSSTNRTSSCDAGQNPRAPATSTTTPPLTASVTVPSTGIPSSAACASSARASGPRPILIRSLIAAPARPLRGEPGLARGGKALLAMNQPDGFDCPGCAWPEPTAASRARIEFCENGAKAVAEEATTKRATPDIFAAQSVDDLRALT